jgi:hypothetical protein
MTTYRHKSHCDEGQRTRVRGNYNGNARPAEMTVNINTNEIYIGNATGALTKVLQVTGAGTFLGNVRVSNSTAGLNQLYFDSATGEIVYYHVYVRTGFAGNIVIEGNVNIPGTVNVASSPENPVHVHLDEIGTSGILDVPYMPIGNTNVVVTGGNITVTGNVNANVSGNVGIVGNIAGITGNIAGITGNIAGITGNVTVNPITGNVNANVSGNVGIVGNINANITGGNVSTTIGGTNLDAFGRLRVSNPFTLFDSQNRYIDGDQFSNITATGGNVVYVANESSFNLNVSATSGSSVIRQSKTVQAYQPGKSLLIMNTFAMATLKANCRQRVGYFTADNGIYFEAVGTQLNLVIRSSVTGTVVEERIPQASWNGNTLLSGTVLDPTLTQIFWCDVEWLGVGNVRTGFVINGEFIVCHTFQHANQPGNTTVYMTTATLNPRYEITNTGATSGTSTMKQICSTVISEGGFTPSTKIAYVTNNTNVTRVASANTITALCSIRLNPAYPDAVVVPSQLDLLLVDVRYGQFQLIENATFTASFSNVAGSVVQTAIHSNVITDGTVVYAGLSSSRDEVEINEDIKRRLQLWRTAAGTP